MALRLIPLQFVNGSSVTLKTVAGMWETSLAVAFVVFLFLFFNRVLMSLLGCSYFSFWVLGARFMRLEPVLVFLSVAHFSCNTMNIDDAAELHRHAWGMLVGEPSVLVCFLIRDTERRTRTIYFPVRGHVMMLKMHCVLKLCNL